MKNLYNIALIITIYSTNYIHCSTKLNAEAAVYKPTAITQEIVTKRQQKKAGLNPNAPEFRPASQRTTTGIWNRTK